MLVVLGALLGPPALDVVDVPLDSIGAQLLFTLGVSFDPLLRRAQPFAAGAPPGRVQPRDAGRPRRRHDRGDHRRRRALRVRPAAGPRPLLIGAVLSPTDPAILIPLFVRLRLRPKVAQTVVAESAFNDPTGAVLALALAGVAAERRRLARERRPATSSVELAISTVIGIVAGVLLAGAISSRRAGIWRESPAIAVLAVVTIAYFSLDTAGGSGYLGAFLAGLIVGNMDLLGLDMHPSTSASMRQFAASVADVVTLFVFVVLGANLPLRHARPDLLPALAVLAALILRRAAR